MAEELVLSAECEAELDRWDLFSEPAGNSAVVRDEEGTFCFKVTKTIPHADLLALLKWGRGQRDEGVKRGKMELQHALCRLLGAEPRIEP